MMEFVQFLAESSAHFYGAIALMGVAFGGMAIVILAIGQAVAMARGFYNEKPEKECGD